MVKKIQLGSGEGFLLLDNDSDKDIKQKVIDYLYNVLNLSNYRYILLNTIEKLKFLQENDYYCSPNFKGINYFLIFMTITNKHYSILIDKKKLSYHKNQLDMKNICVIKIFINTSSNIFSGTIFDGKLVNKDNKYHYLIHDCYQLMNKKIVDMDLKKKILYLNDIINTNEFNCSNFNIKLNKLYNYEDLPELINKIIPSCSLINNGLIFYPKQSGVNILYIDKKIEKIEKIDIESNQVEKIESKTYDLIYNFNSFLSSRTYSYEKEGKTKVLWIKKTEIADVYNLYENKEDLKIGIAHIPNLKISHYCFNNVKDEMVKINCIYNNKFQKWIPLNLC